MEATTWPFAYQEALARKAECFETPEWAVEAVLDVEILTPNVLDPCCGRGVLSKAAKKRGHIVLAYDLHNWGYGNHGADFLTDAHTSGPVEFSVLMNPPFSLACQFVDRARELGARKIVCFQRFAWREGALDKGSKRGRWWRENPPARIWLCGNRANCWRVDIPPEERTSGTTAAHAWFVWERGHKGAEIVEAIYK